jgi:periodic tryptophan protein 1
MSMITATTWVPRGFAAPFPTKYDFDEEEFQRIAELAKLQLDDANEGLEDARKTENGDASQMEGVKNQEADSDDEAPSKDAKSKALVKCAPHYYVQKDLLYVGMKTMT